MAFQLLSEPIRKYIYDKGWSELRPIQNAAVTRILTTDKNYILASRTASGKTEAAFLPILSKCKLHEEGVKVLYISPLIALINDQFFRVEELCKYLDIPVTKWHGEAKVSQKKQLLKSPKGIVLITPESLEAMFVNKPFNVKHLFAQLEFVIIDEIHSFIGSDRGTQLKSILSRLQHLNEKRYTFVGLSATISKGDYEEAKRFSGDEGNTVVLLDKTPKKTNVQFKYFISEENALPLDLLKDLYLETRKSKALIFPNSRGRVEEVAVKLKKISDRVGGHPHYFSHHSSIDKAFREYIEHFAKNSQKSYFSIACTSTLELGIDIGSVDQVVQIDATHSIASLIQRVGRSGRQGGQKSNLFLYATKPWSLLQSLACYQLYQAQFIEPSDIVVKPYDLLLHQALSITKGHSGIRIETLVEQLSNNFAFKEIDKSEITEIVEHLIELDLLEKLRLEVIIGIEGEKVVNSRNFYSVFQSEEEFRVVSSGRKIGAIHHSPQIQEGENILLAARMWTIQLIDFKAKKIEVTKAKDGKKPVFFGGSVDIHPRIREQMFAILCGSKEALALDKQALDKQILDTNCLEIIEELRQSFASYKIQNIQKERPLKVDLMSVSLYTFTGSKINKTIGFLLKLAGIKNSINNQSSEILMETTKSEFLTKWETIRKPLSNIDQHLQELLEESPNVLSFSKWGKFLPTKFQVALLKQKYFDFEGAEELLKGIRLVIGGKQS